MTGISGSGISSSAAQTASAVTIRAPGAERRTSVISSQSAVELGRVRASLRALCQVGTWTAHAARELLALRRLQHAERVRPQLLDGRGEARLVAQPRRPELGVQPVVDLFAVDLRRETGELGVVGLLQRLDPHPVGLLVQVAARDRAAPSRRAAAARRAARTGSRRARGRTRVRRRRCRARRPRARTARARARSRSARSTRTRHPPRASARSPSTPSRASRGSARRQPGSGAACPRVHVPPSGVP